MKYLIVMIIIFINASTSKSKPVENNVGKDFLGDLQMLVKNGGWRKTESLKTILMKYVEAKFPRIDRHQQIRILKVVIRKIKGKILMEITKENLKSPWQAKEDMLARMLK